MRLVFVISRLQISTRADSELHVAVEDRTPKKRKTKFAKEIGEDNVDGADEDAAASSGSVDVDVDTMMDSHFSFPQNDVVDGDLACRIHCGQEAVTNSPVVEPVILEAIGVPDDEGRGDDITVVRSHIGSLALNAYADDALFVTG